MPLPQRNEIIGMTWEDFLEWIRIHFHPGDHMACIGPTGGGKTSFVIPVISQRKYVLAFDPKGGDSTLLTLGWQRLTQWPPPKEIMDGIAEGKPARLIVGAQIKTMEQRPGLRALFQQVLTGAFDMGGWTVYVDEFQLAADRKMMNLGKESETLLIAARDKKASVITSYQAPSWVPTAASRQASIVVIWPTMDTAVIKRLSEILGRPWRELQAAVQSLPEFHVLVAQRSPHTPLIVTSAPKRR